MIEKNQIIEKSTGLMRSFGIKSISMDDISSSLGISKRTLYQVVTDKNQLIVQILESEYFKAKNNLTNISEQSNNPVEELIRINLFMVKFIQAMNPVAVYDLTKYYAELYEHWRLEFRDLFMAMILANIKNGKLEGLYRKDINEEVIAQLHAERIEKLKEENMFWGAEAKSAETIKEMTTYYLRGLITDKGEPLLNKYLQEFSNYLNE
ncbi:MAG: TetR/AcrR family transcriptional regulator [Salinivirgaceae bacterium]|nr:TetR/AcrR family transcriptional regulator [Salinivirgaceae bacterium]